MDEEAADTQPTWFGPEMAPLYGVIHVPAGRRARGGVVICPPLGKEHVDTYRGLKLLAQELCERGFLVLRFDYHATGDSAGELGEVVPGLVELEVAVPPLETCLW